MPDFSLERRLAALHGDPIAGVDEVGRGPWAGPVVAAAVILSPSCPLLLCDAIDDSKALTIVQRQAIATMLPGYAAIGIGAASIREIEHLNILGATMLAMTRAVAALTQQPAAVLVDGNRLPPLPCPCETVVKGDGRSLSIAAASIVAKVFRDRLMARLAVRYPDYAWHTNAGYGTAAHRDGLDAVGVSPHHRRSFAPIRLRLSQVDH